MPGSPLLNSEGLLRIIVKSNGQLISDSMQVVSVHIPVAKSVDCCLCSEKRPVADCAPSKVEPPPNLKCEIQDHDAGRDRVLQMRHMGAGLARMRRLRTTRVQRSGFDGARATRHPLTR
jgi:hypothetical protein